MGKYSSGLDWSAAIAMMGAIEGVHSCHVAFRCTTLGQGRAGGMHIELEATFDVVPGSDLPATVAVSHNWPSPAVVTMEGLFYNLCWQLDYAISQAYNQMPLKGM